MFNNVPAELDNEESVLKCALARIKAGRLSRVTEAYQVPDTATSDLGHTHKNNKPMQAMLASWENHKNNKTRREIGLFMDKDYPANPN